MKKSLLKHLIACTCMALVLFSSAGVHAEELGKPAKIIKKPPQSAVTPSLTRTIVGQGTYNTEDYTRLRIPGTDKRIDNIKVWVKIFDGKFYAYNTEPYYTMSTPSGSTLWTNNGDNCRIVSSDPLINVSGDYFKQRVLVQGNDRVVSNKISLTLSEATTAVNTYGFELSVDGIGKVTNSSQLSSSWGSSTTREVTITTTSNFSMWYEIQTSITGLGSIYTTSW